MVNLKVIIDRYDEVVHMIKWWYSDCKYRYHMVRRRGTHEDFINDVWVKILSAFKDDYSTECTLSTVVINHCRWELARQQGTKASERKMNDVLTMAVPIKHYHKIIVDNPVEDNDDQIQLRRLVNEILISIPVREAAVIRANYGLFGDDQLRLVRIAKILKVSKTRVQQLLIRGILRLKSMDREHYESSIRILSESANRKGL